jgi:hypothetical protein
MPFTNYNERYNWINRPETIVRIQMAAIFIAREVATEATTVQHHAARLVLAKNLVANPETYGRAFAFAIFSNGSLDDTSNDAAIWNEARVVWNFVAGV